MRDRGFVLVNVLILVAALSVVAVGLLQVTARATTRLDAANLAAQAPLVLDAGVAFAARLLAADGLSTSSDDLGESWALTDRVVQTAAGAVRVTVTDLERNLNLNRPLAADGAAFQEVVAGLVEGLGASEDLALALDARYARWRTTEATPPGEDADLMFQDGDLTHLAALTPGPGGAEALRASGLFAALPRDRGVNVNTADEAVLQALPGMTPEQVAALIAARPIRDAAALPGLLQQTAPAAAGLLAQLDTRSHWFEVETQTERDGLTYRGSTILSRDPGSGEVRVHLHQIEIAG